MNAHTFLAPAFQRRLAKAVLRRRTSALPVSRRTFITSSPRSDEVVPAPAPVAATPTLPTSPAAPPTSALAALLSRLSLPPKPSLVSQVRACLTHPSYVPPPPLHPSLASSSETSLAFPDPLAADTTNDRSARPEPNNTVLAPLGSSLLSLFTSEHLSALYPHLPTMALQDAVRAYTSSSSLFSVARELGVGVSSGLDAGIPGEGRGSAAAGVPVLWSRGETDEERQLRLMRRDAGRGGKMGQDRRWKKYLKEKEQLQGEASQGKDAGAVVSTEGAEQTSEGAEQSGKRDGFEEVVASVIRAFVGLIYQEQGIHAARTFVHAHVLSRHLDLKSLFAFTNPKYTLSNVVSRHLAEAGVPVSSGQARIESRMLASTGTHSQSPIYSIGLFLPSGLKLAEGSGSSKSMAEHRAAVNALLSFFLMRGEHLASASTSPELTYGEGLPSSAHVDFPVEGGKIIWDEVRERAWGSKDRLGTGGTEGVVGMRGIGRSEGLKRVAKKRQQVVA